MKFSELMDYIMKNIFLKNHTQNVMEILLPEPSLKNQNWAYFWINGPKFYYSLFFLYTHLSAIEIYWNKAADHLLLPHIKLL